MCAIVHTLLLIGEGRKLENVDILYRLHYNMSWFNSHSFTHGRGEAISKGSYIFCIVFLCAAFVPATFIVGILIDIGVI